MRGLILVLMLNVCYFAVFLIFLLVPWQLLLLTQWLLLVTGHYLVVTARSHFQYEQVYSEWFFIRRKSDLIISFGVGQYTCKMQLLQTCFISSKLLLQDLKFDIVHDNGVPLHPILPQFHTTTSIIDIIGIFFKKHCMQGT